MLMKLSVLIKKLRFLMEVKHTHFQIKKVNSIELAKTGTLKQLM